MAVLLQTSNTEKKMKNIFKNKKSMNTENKEKEAVERYGLSTKKAV